MNLKGLEICLNDANYTYITEQMGKLVKELDI